MAKKTFKFTATATVTAYFEVEAETYEEALEEAEAAAENGRVVSTTGRYTDTEGKWNYSSNELADVSSDTIVLEEE